MNKRIILIIFLLSLILITSAKDENYEPSWIYLKRAENLKEKGEYALALIEARKSKDVLIKEKLDEYYEKIREEHKDKIEYELLTMTKEKEQELLANDNYPLYHELIGDLYVLTDLLDQAENEYEICLAQKKFFDYSQKWIEIKYKMADIYNKKKEYELEDIIYHEIVEEYFNKKTHDFWNRIKINIKNDTTLNHVFRIYRINGTEYLTALYRIGKRNAILKRKNEALFYLVNAGIVWMTHYANLIQKYHFDFQYSSPIDFINYIAKKKIYEYESEDYVMDEILLFIGYIYYLEKEEEIKDHYFNLAKIFSKNTKREVEIKNRIDYLNKYENHSLSFDEVIY